GHGLLTALPRVAHEPADGEGVGPARLDLDRDLVGGATDPAAAHLELGADVVDGSLQGADRVIAAGLGLDDVERRVDDALGRGALAALEDLVDELGDDDRPVDRVGHELAAGCGTLAGHVSLPSSRRSG